MLGFSPLASAPLAALAEEDPNVLVALTGVSASGAVGTVTVTAGATLTLTGVSATGEVGSVTATSGTGVSLTITGVSATGAVGRVLVWGLVPPSPTVDWSDTPTDPAVWEPVTSPSAVWSETPTDPAVWSPVDPCPDPDWKDVAA